MTREDVRNVHFLDDSNWADFVEADKVSLLFFMAGGHLECRRQVPLIIDFAKRYGEVYNVCVMDAAKSRVAAKCCDVRDLPTSIVVRRGVFMGGRRGGIDPETEAELVEMLDSIQAVDIETYLQNSVERAAAPIQR